MHSMVKVRFRLPWFTGITSAVPPEVLMLTCCSRGSAVCLSLCALLLGMLCTNVVLKHLVARPRPWLTVEGLIPLIAELFRCPGASGLTVVFLL